MWFKHFCMETVFIFFLPLLRIQKNKTKQNKLKTKQNNTKQKKPEIATEV